MENTVHVFKAALARQKSIWRRIAVRSDQTLDDLHWAICRKHSVNHPLRPLDGAALPAARAKSADGTRKRDQFFILLGALWIHAADANEAEVQVAAAGEGGEEVLHSGVNRPVLRCEPHIPRSNEIIEGVFDDLLERVGSGPRPVAEGSPGGQGRHAETSGGLGKARASLGRESQG